MALDTSIKSVLVIGSGPIVIGQACEFDYSGTQACRVLKSEGIRVILVNSNPATIMTDPEFADATYVEPITPEAIEQILIKEKPDAVLATLGGQTALNAAMGLHERGILQKHGVRLIGADVDAINRGENMEVTTYLEKTIDSELSANVIDLCPVGALTSKPYAFEARPWELTKTESIDVMDAVGSNIRVDTKGWEVKRILPRLNDEINEEWISDKSLYACDGLLKNRLDTPFIKVDGKLKACTWDEAFKFILDNTKGFTGDKVFGAVGDLVDVESMYMFKKFFKGVLS